VDGPIIFALAIHVKVIGMLTILYDVGLRDFCATGANGAASPCAAVNRCMLV
jgi:hypothetical protein